MAPSLGYFTLWLSLCFTILQFFTSFKKDTNSIPQFHKIAVIGLLLSTLFSFFSLMYSHIISDFSVLNVFQIHTQQNLCFIEFPVFGEIMRDLCCYGCLFSPPPITGFINYIMTQTLYLFPRLCKYKPSLRLAF